MPPIDISTCCPLKAREFAKIRQLAYDTCGLDLWPGKETLVAARLGKRMREAGCQTFDDYYQHVTEDATGESLIGLIDALTTNHTSFFREPAHFDFLRSHLLPQWRNRTSIDIWSAACSSGEEPYSIAMCLSEELDSEVARVRILATDISTRVLDKAARGIYPAERLEGVPVSLLRKYWLRGERGWAGSYRAKSRISRLVEFRRLNLLESPASLGAFALIVCRNVMIYFDKPAQQRVVQGLSDRLEPGGYLFIGHSENLHGIRHGLEYVCAAIYRKPSTGGKESRKPWT